MGVKQSSARPATIYIVDGNDAVRDSLRIWLEAESFTVFDFASGAEFLRSARPKTHSCLLLDVHMPGMSGIELLDRICSDKFDISVILMTGCPSPAIENAAARAGAALIEKPFRGRELFDAIKRSLDGSSGL